MLCIGQWARATQFVTQMSMENASMVHFFCMLRFFFIRHNTDPLKDKKDLKK